MGANAEMLKAVWEAFAAGDMDGGLAHFDAGAQIVVPATLPWAGAYVGPSGYLEASGILRRILTAFRPQPEAFIEDGDHVAVPIDLEGSTTAGNDLRWRALWLYRIRDGRIVRAELFIDTARAIEDTRDALAAADARP